MRIESSGIFPDGSFFLPPAGGMKGFFPVIYCGNLLGLLDANLKILWASYNWVRLELLILRVAHFEPLAIHQLQFRFSFPSTGSHCLFSASKALLPYVETSCIHLSVSLILGAMVCQVSSPLLQVQEGC